MGLEKQGEIWYITKRINGQRFRESTGFADNKSAERRAVEIEHGISAGVHGWKSTIPSFAEWWAVYRKTYTPLKSARNRDAQIVAHFLPHFGAKRLDEITKSDIVRYLESAGEDAGRTERHWKCDSDAAAAGRNEPLAMFCSATRHSAAGRTRRFLPDPS